MDPITAAIVAAVSAGVINGITETSKTMIIDTYTKLKAMLVKKFGSESEVVYAVNEVEAKPRTAGRKAMLQAEVAAAKADQDPQLLEAANMLLAQIKGQQGGEQYLQNAIGDYNIQVQGSGNTINQNKG